jgi:type II secretory pathway pseudopilin PulG
VGAAIAVPNFMNAQTRARVARVRADVKSLTTALEQYRMDRNDYPIDMGGPNEREQLSWKQLTTPVSYISSTDVCRDPFTHGLAGATGGTFSGVRTYYDYGGGTWHESLSGTDSQARKKLYEEDSRAGFIILSFGPNRAREFPWGSQNVMDLGLRRPAGLLYVYNASNGVTSAGDIFAVRGGPIE